MVTGDPDSAPSSPGHAPGTKYTALLQLAKGRRGRTLIISAVFVVVLLGLMFSSSAESLSYKNLSSLKDYHLPSWRPKGPSEIPKSKDMFTPSNTTLEIENDNLRKVPSHLKKETPSFHLLMPATSDGSDFCKTAISAMIMDYPPPTIINYKQEFHNNTELELEKVKNVLQYLLDEKHVQDDDLVMIVDGYDVYFQLPSKVLVKQYQDILAEANQRLKDKYGLIYPEDDVVQAMYNQTVVWGADKRCWPEQGNATACPTTPESPIPTNIYGLETDKTETLTRAKYLNAGTVIGPAKDLRAIFAAALPRMVKINGTEPTAQYIFSTLFAEQEFAREKALKDAKSAPPSWRGWFSNKVKPETGKGDILTQPPPRVEFSMGLDYTHTLFQPTTFTAPKELVPRPHSEMQTLHHVNTPTPPLVLPNALLDLPPPYHTLDPEKDHSPNPMSPLVKPLEPTDALDDLPAANKPWSEIPLWTNTYTGAVPALLHLNRPPSTPFNRDAKLNFDKPIEINKPPEKRVKRDDDEEEEKPVVGWDDLWFHPHARALARAALRTTQGSLAWHAAAVGGDSWWDMRGGKGGVWTIRGNYLGWGEEDGVCFGSEMNNGVFGDDKGLWLKEGEAERLKQEDEERRKKEEEERQKQEEEKKKQEEEEERKKQEEDEKKKQEEEEKKKQEEEDKKLEEAKKIVEEAERKKAEEEAKKEGEGKEQ